MAWLLHFTGEGYGVMSGITEYLVLYDGEDEPSGEELARKTAPGFSLNTKTDLYGVDLPGSLPLGHTLIPRF